MTDIQTPGEAYRAGWQDALEYAKGKGLEPEATLFRQGDKEWPLPEPAPHPFSVAIPSGGVLSVPGDHPARARMLRNAIDSIHGRLLADDSITALGYAVGAKKDDDELFGGEQS